MKSIANPFKIEEQRAQLAAQRKLNQLAKKYADTYSEIPDKNTSKLWDYLNLEGKVLVGKNPMEEYRIHSVNELINGDNISLLNIGFGSANLEKVYFKDHFAVNTNWKGIDISSKSVKEAKKRFAKCKFELGDILDLKEKNDTFDYVTSLEVLEHIKPSKIFKALSEVYRVLKHGGYFIASVPLNEGLKEMIERGENPNAHVRIYTPELIKAELEIAGFKIIFSKTLYAFHRFYNIKTFVARYILPQKYKPNNIIILAQKI